MIDVLPAGAPVPEGSVYCEGQLQDVLYHGASSRCHVRIDAHDHAGRRSIRDSRMSASTPFAAGDNVRLAWRPEHAVPLQG